MNNKIICRIVSNIYNLFDEGNPLNDEIELLRAGQMSNNNILNELYILFKWIIKCKGKMDYFELLDRVQKIFHYEFSIKSNENIELMYLYYKNDCLNFVNKYIDINFVEGDEKYKFILLGILLNIMQFRATEEMYIYHPNVLYSFKYKSCHNQIISSAREETLYYYKKKHIFSIEDIKEAITNFFIEYSMFDSLISNVYLFGSYAKKKNDEYSDVDLFFEFKKRDESLIVFEQLVRNYLKTNYDMDTDVLMHFKGECFDRFENTILSYSIPLM